MPESSALQNNTSLKSRIVREAAKLGFSLAGVSLVGDCPHFDDFSRWLSKDFHGEMAYLARQSLKRRNPRSVFSEVETILVLGMPYYTRPDSAPAPLKGRISRYALGEDYHGVMGERLQALLRYIRDQEPSADGRCYVDTGPVMEKAWGAETALGWMGKHTNLISKHQGSWFFLGVILLNLPLEPDSRAKNHCGTCRRCIDACPTGAIVAPYVLDARLCISYLTIEYRGLVPRRLRPLVGNRIFGCDVCQDACPWNRFAAETRERSFRAAGEGMMRDLAPLARMSPSEFRSRFRNSPIFRATRDGFVRNVVTALGNSGEEEAAPALKAALEDASAVVRASAVWALAKVSGNSVREMLPGILARERDPMVLQEIESIL